MTKKITQQELDEIIRLHGLWLERKDGGVRADLTGADLTRANLTRVVGNMREIKSSQIEGFMVTYTKDRIFIGCKAASIEEWKSYTDEEIAKMDDGALEWWKKWKDWIIDLVEVRSPAV